MREPPDPNKPDPLLKEVMEEIKAILNKHDLAGNIVISSERHIEYVRHFETSWCRCYIDPGGFARVKCKRADFPDKQLFERVLRATIGTIAGFRDVAFRDSEDFLKLLKVIAKTVGFEHITKHLEDSVHPERPELPGDR